MCDALPTCGGRTDQTGRCNECGEYPHLSNEERKRIADRKRMARAGRK